jgi:tRNA (guanine-N7-)-methyltransferase
MTNNFENYYFESNSNWWTPREVHRDIITRLLNGIVQKNKARALIVYYPEYLLPKNSISNIYLNFSCPYPKKQYENHRLTYCYFLDIYKYLMKSGAKIEQKTDSDSLFEFSKQSFIDNGFILEYVTDDLYSEPHDDNIPTEYETKFVSENIKIHKLIAT